MERSGRSDYAKGVTAKIADGVGVFSNQENQMSAGNSWTAQTWLIMARWGLGGILLAAGVSKIAHPYDFLGDVYNYGLLSSTSGYITAYWLPWVEVVTGVCLIMQISELGAAAMSVVLFLVFTIVKATAVHRDLDVTCGCLVTADRGVIGLIDVIASAFGLAAAVSLFLLLRWNSHHALRRRVVAESSPALTGNSASGNLTLPA
jgi:hypothetical protein